MSRPAEEAGRPAPVRVGIGEIRVAESPERLAIFGIGSCVAVFLHDPGSARAGLAHPLLPGEPPRGAPPAARAKYAPAAVRLLAEELRQHHRGPARLAAKVVGGASMFSCENGQTEDAIGTRNVTAVLGALDALDIPVLASETGGRAGRSLIADPASGRLEVWSLGTARRLL